MKIIEKANQKNKKKFGFWNRKFRGHAQISINGGTYTKKFRTLEIYNAAKEYMANSTFANPLDLREWLGKLVSGFEQDQTTVPMMEKIQFANGIFLPAAIDDNFVDS